MSRFQDLRSELERFSGLEVASVSDDYLEMRITTYVPTVLITSPNYEGKYEHELAIKFDTTTMTIEAVQVSSCHMFCQFCSSADHPSTDCIMPVELQRSLMFLT